MIELGELKDEVHYRLLKPFMRIDNIVRDGDKNKRVAIKKLLKKRVALMRSVKTYEVDNSLMRHIAKQPSVFRGNPRTVAREAFDAIPPSPYMWVEFNAKPLHHILPDLIPLGIVGVLIHPWYLNPDDTLYNFYVSKREDDQVIFCAHGIMSYKKECEDLPDDHHLDQILTGRYDAEWEGQEYLALKKKIRISNVEFLESQDVEAAPSLGYEAVIANFPAWQRPLFTIVNCIISTLNYPWISKEEVRYINGRKSVTPRILPHDSYYRCKINLPKPDGIDIRNDFPAREESYGVRQHQVRGHYRTFKNEDGSFKSRTWVQQFVRGNPKLGVIHKDYVLTSDDNDDDDIT